MALFPDGPQEIADAIQVRHRATFGGTIQVLNRIPNPRLPEFILVLGVGGVQRDPVTDVPTLAVEAWANTRTRASELARQARAIIHSLEGSGTAGYAVPEVAEFAGPADLPDPLSNQFRYTATYAVAIRTESIINITQ
jgi:hypothetical protein